MQLQQASSQSHPSHDVAGTRSPNDPRRSENDAHPAEGKQGRPPGCAASRRVCHGPTKLALPTLMAAQDTRHPDSTPPCFALLRTASQHVERDS
eukprot:scaffold923_cov256-Pinguiococcus_pyrenoidosus.AAC.14